jgi:hypothetical protein
LRHPVIKMVCNKHDAENGFQCLLIGATLVLSDAAWSFAGSM